MNHYFIDNDNLKDKEINFNVYVFNKNIASLAIKEFLVKIKLIMGLNFY